MTSDSIKTLSLFTGAGGLDIGFHIAGYQIVACVEIEQKYCKTLEKLKIKQLNLPLSFFSLRSIYRLLLK